VGILKPVSGQKVDQHQLWEDEVVIFRRALDREMKVSS
jgi:hypothetical protein